MSAIVFEMCRCCGDFDLPTTKHLIPIFAAGHYEEVMMKIRNVLIRCWEIQIAENDGFPQHLCTTCFGKIDAYFTLRAFCRSKQNQLNAFFKKMTSDREERCLVLKENETTNNENVNTKEGANKSLACNKKQQVKTKTKTPKALQRQNNETTYKNTSMLKNIEFVAIPKTQVNLMDSIMDDCDKLDTIEAADFEEFIDLRQDLGALKSQEILKQLKCHRENDHDKKHATLDKQPLIQQQTDCEVLLEDEMSLSEVDKYDDYEYLEQPNNIENEHAISSDDDDDDFEEENLDETKKVKKLSYRNLYLNPLVCKFCCYDDEIDTISLNDVVFESKEALSAHIKLKHNASQPFTCPICKKSYKSLTQCRSHITSAHKKKRSICWICGVEMNAPYLGAHIARCHKAADFECELCGKKFKNTSLAVFKYHKRWHMKNKQFKCQLCEKVFIMYRHLRVHMLVHTKNYTIKCDKCDKGFRTNFDQRVHMHRIHGDALPIKCRYCEERFPRYEERMKHMIEMHDYAPNLVDEKIKCLKCNKEFRRETGFRKHLKMDCQRPKQKYIQKKQIFVPKPKNYSCHQCSRLFGKESALLKHIPLHSNEGRPFQCDVCQLYYKTQSHLEIHKRLKHSDEKPFTCDTCGKRFAYKFTLNEHNKFHEAKANKQKLLETEQENNILDSLDKS